MKMSACRRYLYDNRLECIPTIPSNLEKKTWDGLGGSGAWFDGLWEELPACPSNASFSNLTDIFCCGGVTFQRSGSGVLLRSDGGSNVVDCGVNLELESKGFSTLGDMVFSNMTTLRSL
jgi:hypothetical protein